jgi:hypothetical protein
MVLCLPSVLVHADRPSQQMHLVLRFASYCPPALLVAVTSLPAVIMLQ